MSRRKNADLFTEIPISRIRSAIDEWIQSEQDRRIMIQALIVHASYAAIAEAEGLSERQISRRIHRAETRIYTHL